MGLWQSSLPSNTQNQETVSEKIARNNNSGDVVIIPVDGSPQAELAFKWYVKHMHKDTNEVRIIHCQEVPPNIPMMSEHTVRSTENWKQSVNDTVQKGQSIQERYEQQLALNNIKGTTTFEMGKPSEIIINCIDKYKGSHIVMGTRGFGVIRRTILGSVSEYVLKHSKIPVTVVPKDISTWF